MLGTHTGAAEARMTELIVNVAQPEREAPLLDYAFALARQLGAWLTGLCVIPVDPLVLALPDALGQLADEERAAVSRRDEWLARCRAAGIEGEWEVRRGSYRKVLADRASLASLVIGRLPLCPGTLQDASRRLAETLVRGGCPVLLVPDAWMSRPQLAHAVLAWNGRAAAARAARAALPLLRLAHQVSVLDGSGTDTPAAPLREWLAREAIPAQWHRLPDDARAEETIHREAQRLGADLLVHGAWGHARSSELLFGGVTRHSLQHSRVPLLLAP